MKNSAIVTKTIRFNRAVFANTLAIIATMQQYGGNLLKTTLDQSSGLPGNSKKACLYWSEAWTTNLQNMTGMIDRGFAEIERLSSPPKMSDQDTSLKTAAAGKIRAPLPATEPPANHKKPATTRKSAARSTPPAKTVAKKKAASGQNAQPVKAAVTGPATVEPLPPIENHDAKNMVARIDKVQVTTTALAIPSQKLPADAPKITEATSKREIPTDVGN